MHDWCQEYKNKSDKTVVSEVTEMLTEKLTHVYKMSLKN